jgi:hypothetical protein
MTQGSIIVSVFFNPEAPDAAAAARDALAQAVETGGMSVSFRGETLLAAPVATPVSLLATAALPSAASASPAQAAPVGASDGSEAAGKKNAYLLRCHFLLKM